MKQKNRGITLIALIITIIVMLIMASIATYSGIEIIATSKFTAFETELKIMQTEVNELYDNYRSNKTIEVDGITYYGESEEGNSNNKLTILNIGEEITGEIKEQADIVFNELAKDEQNKIQSQEGFKFFSKELIGKLGVEGVKQDLLINIKKRQVVSYRGFEYEGRIYYIISQIPSGLYNVEYIDNLNIPTFEVRVEKSNNNKWKLTIYDINYNGYIEKWKVKYRLSEEEYWRTSEELEITVEEIGEYNFIIYNEDIESEIKTMMINPKSITGMQMNFVIKNKTYAPEGDVYEYYSVDTNRLQDYTVKKIVFGKFSDYETKVQGIEPEPIDLNRTGTMNLYRVLNSDNTTYTIYILSKEGVFELSENAAWTFDKLYELESIENLHLLDTSKVTNMRDMFCDCPKLKDIDLSNFDTSNVTNMIGMFARCYELEYLDLTTFDVSNIKEISQIFSDNTKLKAIHVSDKWNLPTGEEIDIVGMFTNNNSLVGGNGTKFDSTKVTGTMAVVDGAQKGYLTKNYELATGINVNHIIKGKTAAEIKEWTVEKRYTDRSVTSVILGQWRDYYKKVEGYASVATDSQKSGAIRTYRVPNGDGTYAVYILSNNGTFVAKNDSSWLFDKLTMLRKIENLTLLDTSKVTLMRDMFCDCQSIESLDLSNFNTQNVTSMVGMFARMYVIKEIDISSFNTNKVELMTSMFVHSISTTDTIDIYLNAIPALEKIYVSNTWTAANLTTPTESIFQNNIKLVGGNGTTFNENNVAATYARVDTSTTPGYFTLKNETLGDSP